MRYAGYYTPSGWAFLKIQSHEQDDVIVKVFASWVGGYTAGDSWRLNSGVTKIEENDTEYVVLGYSGSGYILSKKSNYITSWNRQVLDDMIAELRSYGHQAEIISVQEAILLIGD